MLNFQNAEIVSLQIANDFFGDVFAYKQTQTVSIEGSVEIILTYLALAAHGINSHHFYLAITIYQIS